MRPVGNRCWLQVLSAITFCTGLVSAEVSYPTKFFLSDEGKDAIHYIDLDEPTKSWTTETESGLRDLQLVGNNRVMLSCKRGFLEFDVTTGDQLRYVNVYSGVGSARRLLDGRTFVSKKDDNKVVVVSREGIAVDTIELEKPVHRMMRVTARGTLIYGCQDEVVEADTATGAVVWSRSVQPLADEVYVANRVSDSCVWVGTGYDNSLIRIDGDGTLTEYTARGEDHPHEFAGFQLLPGGRVVVANWQGHGDGHGEQGHQFLQFNIEDQQVNWFWEQESERISSINNILVVDGLDPAYMWTDAEGILKRGDGETAVLKMNMGHDLNGDIRQSSPKRPQNNESTLLHRIYDLRGASLGNGYSKTKRTFGIRILHKAASDETRPVLTVR